MKPYFALVLLLLLFIALTSVAFAHNTLDPLHLLPRPLALEYPSSSPEIDQEGLQLRCASWRFAAEVNNLAPWRTVPAECGAHVREYVTGRAYRSDLEMVAGESSAYARSIMLAGDGRDAWIFDVDETMLSNLPYYADHGFGLEVFDRHKFEKWVDKAMAPAIQSTLTLYEEVVRLGFKIILMTGRSEGQMAATVDNLKRAGYHEWEKLITRGVNDLEKSASVYKSERRGEIVADGYRILGNSGDQWSDLLGSSMSNRSFKLPNPMYYIP